MRNRFSWMFVGGCLLALTMLALTIGGQLFLSRNSVASAQMAETAAFNGSGDFNTAIVQGNRGFYGSYHWLVAPQLDTTGVLNCRRTPGGSIRSRIVSGGIITARFTGPVQLDGGLRPNRAADAIVSYQGKPWLRITGTESGVVFPSGNGSNDYIGECYVRANSQYIIPISNDAQLSPLPARWGI